MTTEQATDNVRDQTEEKPEAMKSVSDLLCQGKRNMVCGQIPQAVNLYQEAVQLLVKSCGELSRDCADAYFCCGSALLELGRMETNVLGVALEGVDVEEEKDMEISEQFEKPPEDDGEERHQLREHVYEAMAEGDREAEFQKSLAEKYGADGGSQTSTELTGLETELAEVLPAGTKSADGDKQHLVTAASEDRVPGAGGGTQKQDGVTAGNKQEQADNSQSEVVDNSGKVNTTADSDSISQKEEKQMETSAAVSEQSQTDDSTHKTALGDTDAGQQGTECTSDKLIKPAGDVEQETCAEKIVMEAVKEACQKIVEEQSQQQPATALPDDGIVATDKADFDENADVDMAEDGDDAMNEGDSDAADDDADNVEIDTEDNEDEKADDVPNFQLAWEYLELAKVIYLKSNSVDDQLKAAECHIKLGELSMETEQYSTAAGDLETALKIQEKHLPASDRLIAETHYQLGLAYGLYGKYEQSIEQYTRAISVLQSKIESLSQLVKEKEVNGENKENAEVGELRLYQDEIKELQDLIPEIRNKVEDMRLEAREVLQVKQMAQEAVGFSPTTQETDRGALTSKMDTTDLSAGDSVGHELKASDIGHLVRKKRKPETDLADEAQEVKKIRPDNCGDCSSEVLREEPVSQTSEPDAVNVAETVEKSAELRAEDASPTATGQSVVNMIVEIPTATGQSEVSMIVETPTATGQSEMSTIVETATATGQSEMSTIVETATATGQSEMSTIVETATATGQSEMSTIVETATATGQSEMSTIVETATATGQSEMSTIVETPTATGQSEMNTIAETPTVTGQSEMSMIAETPTATGQSEMNTIAETPTVPDAETPTVPRESVVNMIAETPTVTEQSVITVAETPTVTEQSVITVAETPTFSGESVVNTIAETPTVTEESVVNTNAETPTVTGEIVVNTVAERATVTEQSEINTVVKTTTVTGQSEMRMVAEISSMELAAVIEASTIHQSFGGQLQAACDTSEVEPATAECVSAAVDAISNMSEAEPVNEAPDADTISNMSEAEPVNGGPDVDNISKIAKPEPFSEDSSINEALKVDVVDGTANEAFKVDGTANQAFKVDGSANEASKLDTGNCEACVISESSTIEPLNGESQVDAVSQSSNIKSLIGESEMDMVIESSKVESLNGESEMDMLMESSKVEPFNGTSKVAAVNQQSTIEPLNGESEMDMIKEPSKIEPGNGKSEMDTINKSSKIEPVNGESKMDSVNESSKIELVNGETVVIKQVTQGEADTVQGDFKMVTVVTDSCSLNNCDDVSMETETSAS